jgi:hypothetical protein
VDYKAAGRIANVGDFDVQASWDSGQRFLAIGQDKTLAETEQAKTDCQVNTCDVATGLEVVEEIGTVPESEQGTGIDFDVGWEIRTVLVVMAAMGTVFAEEMGSGNVPVGEEVDSVPAAAAGGGLDRAVSLEAWTGHDVEEIDTHRLAAANSCLMVLEEQIPKNYGTAAEVEAG